MSTLAAVVVLAYAGILIGGGFAGWKLSGSRVSFTAALGSAALLAIAYRIAFFHLLAGYLLAAVVSLALTVLFFLRFRKTRKVMPAGMMLVASGVALAIFGWFAANSL